MVFMGKKAFCGQEGDMLLEKKKKTPENSTKELICAAEVMGNNKNMTGFDFLNKMKCYLDVTWLKSWNQLKKTNLGDKGYIFFNYFDGLTH